MASGLVGGLLGCGLAAKDGYGRYRGRQQQVQQHAALLEIRKELESLKPRGTILARSSEEGEIKSSRLR